ncbi:MAG: DnaJ domain-containing protein [Deltaproteobacteria bacterium]|nr:DnaJ domain-containing protein [Deltaproteobacteria bacterium]
MSRVDYYQRLGVDRDASDEEISKAYKRLARKYHPDLNKAADAEQRFKELNEAYDVLRDPEQRRRYDIMGSGYRRPTSEAPPSWDGSNGGGASDAFSDLFSNFFRGGERRRRRTASFEDLFGEEARQRAGANIESTITINLDEIYLPRKLSVKIDGPAGRRRYEVRIPPGTRDGDRIRLAGQGMPGPNGQRGDLHLTVRVAPHERFSVLNDDDLLVEVKVSAWDAALGARLRVPTLDGSVALTLPPGQSSGQRLRLRGKGLPKRDGEKGDLYAEIRITVPKTLTDEQRELFEKLRGIEHQKTS